MLLERVTTTCKLDTIEELLVIFNKDKFSVVFNGERPSSITMQVAENMHSVKKIIEKFMSVHPFTAIGGATQTCNLAGIIFKFKLVIVGKLKENKP